MAGGRGNAKEFQSALKRMADDFIENSLGKSALEIALDIRQRAEDNTRDQLGSEPGAPDMANAWFAGPVLLDTSETEGGHERSVAELSTWKPGDSIFVWNPLFYAYFHEKGYYSQGGGARPKWMLQKAITAAETTERTL